MFEEYQRTRVTARMVSPQTDCGAAVARKLAKGALDFTVDDKSPDLVPVSFIIASEHENDNGDYLPRSELISARATCAHKPFDIEHELEEESSYVSSPLFNMTRNTIVGHMVASALADKQGNILNEQDVARLDTTDNPNRPANESLDLVAAAVLYSFYFPKTVSDIRKMAAKGSMFVSMESWFKNHDYMVDSKIVANKGENDEQSQQYQTMWSAGLKCGTRRVCRVLRNVIFGGVASTRAPANKESVYLSVAASAELNILRKKHDALHAAYFIEPSQDIVREHEKVTRAAASLLKGGRNNG